MFAATQAVQDTNWLNKAIKHNNYWSEKIFNVTDEIGIATNRTNVNFFLLNFDFVDKCRKEGIEIPIIPGIKILSTEKHLTALPKHFFIDLPKHLRDSIQAKTKNEIRNAGKKWAVNQIQELIERDAPCIHLYIMASSKLASEVVSEFILLVYFSDTQKCSFPAAPPAARIFQIHLFF